MHKKILVTLLLFAFGYCLVFSGCGSAKSDSATEQASISSEKNEQTVSNSESVTVASDVDSKTATNGELTSVTLNDLKDYIDIGSSIYVLQGTNLNSALSFSYDSSVIKSVSLDTSKVDTNATPGEIVGSMYDADYVIVVDVDKLCEKENKTNGMTGDTAQVAGTLTVTVVTRDQADQMIEYGAYPENIIGY